MNLKKLRILCLEEMTSGYTEPTAKIKGDITELNELVKESLAVLEEKDGEKAFFITEEGVFWLYMAIRSFKRELNEPRLNCALLTQDTGETKEVTQDTLFGGAVAQEFDSHILANERLQAEKELNKRGDGIYAVREIFDQSWKDRYAVKQLFLVVRLKG